MVYVGIDLHRSRSQIAVLDQQGGELLSRRIANDREIFLELLHGLGDDVQVALEATYGWEWLADLLEDAGVELHLAHPLRTKAIAAARVKTDAVDARTLAHLLRTDLLPEAYIAPRELRDLRDLLRHRVALTRIRSALKQRVGAILAKQGIARPYSNLFGPGGSRFLTELELRQGPRLGSTACSRSLLPSTARSTPPPRRSSSGQARIPTSTSSARSAASAATPRCS